MLNNDLDMLLEEVQTLEQQLGRDDFVTAEDRQRVKARKSQLELKFWKLNKEKQFRAETIDGSVRTDKSNTPDDIRKAKQTCKKNSNQKSMVKEAWNQFRESKFYDPVFRKRYALGVSAAGLGLAGAAMALRPDYTLPPSHPYQFSGFDNDYNTIEGFKHTGYANKLRADFGSGWLGLFGSMTGIAGIVYGASTYSTKIPKHELIGMSYLGMEEQELYETLTRPQNRGMGFDLFAREEETAATVGTSFHEYLEALKEAQGGVETEKFIFSKKHGLAGYADVIYDDGTVSDIKTVTNKVFQEVKRRGAPLQKHFDQVNTYAVLNESRTGRIEYYHMDDPQKKVVYDWETNQDNFQRVMGKVSRVRDRIGQALANGELREDDLPMKAGITAQRIHDIFVGQKYSYDVTGVKDALNNFISKRERYHDDRRNSTFEQLQEFNISERMDGNKAEYIFRAAQNAGRRHINMG